MSWSRVPLGILLLSAVLAGLDREKTGIASIVLVLAASGYVGLFVARAGSAWLGWAARLAVALLVALVFANLLFVVPATFALATRPVLIMAAGAALALAVAFVPPADPSDPRRPFPASRTVTILSALILVVVFLAVAQRVRRTEDDSDNMFYHLPMAAEWARTGSIAPLHTIPVIARGYPGFKEAIIALVASLDGTVHLYTLLLAGAELGLFAATLVALSSLGTAGSLRTPLLIGLYAICVPEVVIASAGTDLLLAGCAQAALLFLARWALAMPGTREASYMAGVAGLALGAVVSCKYSGFAYAGVFGLGAMVLRLTRSEWTFPRRAAGELGLLIGGVLLVAVPWYARNALVFQNPLYPAPLALGSILLAPGAIDPAWLRANTLGLNLRPIVTHADFFVEAFGIAFVAFAPAPLVLIARGVLARRGADTGRAIDLFIGVAALASWLVFLHTPFTTFESTFTYNMRFALVAFALSAVSFARAVAQLPPRLNAIALAAAGLAALVALIGWTRWWPFCVAGIVLASTRPLWPRLARPLRHIPPTAFRVAATVVVVIALAGVEQVRTRGQYDPEIGYRNLPSGPGWGDIVRFVHARLHRERIAVIGDNRSFPLLGEHFENTVFFIPHDFVLTPPMPTLDEALTHIASDRPSYVACFAPVKRNATAQEAAQEVSVDASLGHDLLTACPDDFEPVVESHGSYLFRVHGYSCRTAGDRGRRDPDSRAAGQRRSRSPGSTESPPLD
jgi:hypothetical protein